MHFLHKCTFFSVVHRGWHVGNRGKTLRDLCWDEICLPPPPASSHLRWSYRLPLTAVYFRKS